MSSDESGSESGQEVYVRTLTRRDRVCVPTNVGTALAISAAPVYGSEEWNQWNNREINAIDTNRSIRLDVMMSWRVIGWTEESGQTLLFTHSDVDGNDYRNQYSDTIFPVIGIHVDESHIPGRVGFYPMTYNQELIAILMQRYRQKMCLTLIQNPELPRVQIVVSVPTNEGYSERTVESLSAGLVCLFFKIENRTYVPSTLYTIEWIVDSYNPITQYCLWGIGECPETEGRVLWELPNNVGFQWNLNRTDNWVQRTGYLVSKDSLLVVSESKKVDNVEGVKNQLLKEWTYVIIDGISMHWYYYSEDAVEFEFKLRSDSFPYFPKLVVIPEGVNLLTVQIFGLQFGLPRTNAPDNWRRSWLYLQCPSATPIVIDWIRFQSDFECEESMIEMPFKQIMHFEDINDYIIVDSTRLECKLLFSLFFGSIYNNREKRFSDHFNVFVPIDDQHWVYMCSVVLVYQSNQIRSPLVFRNAWMQPMLFSETISDPNGQYFQQTLNQLRQTFIPYVSTFPLAVSCRILCQNIGQTPLDHYYNPGQYTYQRFNKLQIIDLVFSDDTRF